MWINPKYQDQVREPSPPTDDGKRLAEIPRGNQAVLRINLSEYQGHPYLSFRVWERGDDGRLWPVRGKGMSIRISEVPHVRAALLRDEVQGLVDDEAERPTYVDKRPGWRRRYDRAVDLPTTPTPRGGSGEFDEFAAPG